MDERFASEGNKLKLLGKQSRSMLIDRDIQSSLKVEVFVFRISHFGNSGGHDLGGGQTQTD